MLVFRIFQRLLSAFAIILIIYVQLFICQSNDGYEKCGKLFQCGDLKNVGYPFSGNGRPENCGYPGFELKCEDDVPLITIESIDYRVLKVDDGNFTVAREDLWNSPCPTRFDNTVLDVNLFNYTRFNQNITIFYNCSILGTGTILTLPFQFNCNQLGLSFYIASGYALNDNVTCRDSIIVPVSADAARRLTEPGSNENSFRSALTSGFGLQWFANKSMCNECIESGGRCVYDNSTNSFACLCNDEQYPRTCNGGQGRGSRRYIIPTLIGIAIFVTAAGIAVLSFVSYYRANKRKGKKVETFIKQLGAVGPKHYSYSEIKKMTNSFADKLGEGGYGSVYKGKLPDGRLVAVKVLSGTKGNGEDFINEVASISRTSHVNIVTLLGFCLHKDRRALIFQFMPNGSLDKFIKRNRPPDSEIHMDCKTLFRIAVGTARGLEYLHRGCNTRIVHFDIKPHNILLDEDFCPKISDFGLAKLSETKDSMFSRLSARGTIGYIAPEFIFRHFGGVSPKSDVYSYGMMILEMVGVRSNPNIEVDRSSQLYFPNWIYDRLELGKGLEIQVVQDEEEEEMERKLILVGLWCIQTKPSDRPSMTKVVEMLEGSLQSLQLPPKPFLYSPPTSPQESPRMSPQHSSTS